MLRSDYYTFIKPVSVKPRDPEIYTERQSVLAKIDQIIQTIPRVVFFDLETTSLVYADPNQLITTVGLATDDWLVGLGLVELTPEELEPLWNWLARQKLGGFNLSFDLAWPWRTPLGDGRVNPNVSDKQIYSDTALWFRLLGTEAHFKQKYDLETAIEKILNWPTQYLQKHWLHKILVEHQLSKSKMYHLSLIDPENYTRYCALDAEASMQLHTAFSATLDFWKFGGLRDYHEQILAPNIKRSIVATCHGIPVDRTILARNIDWVNRRLVSLEAAILGDPLIAEHIQEFEQNKLEKTHKLGWNLRKIWAKASDKPWEDPKTWRLRYEPDPQVREKLPNWCKEFGGKFFKPETRFTISKSSEEWPRLNVSSRIDMVWLIYDKLLEGKYDVWYRDPNKPKMGGLVNIWYHGKQYSVKLTESGSLPTGGDILNLFGSLGKNLKEYKVMQKLLGDFLKKFYIASKRTGYVHPQSKILGTVTGRNSAGNESAI